MADSRAERTLGQLHRLLSSAATPTHDGALLDRFVRDRDEDAFGELVARHGPLVYGLCRRVLGNVHDAEDVFQAAFLVLARKAASIRKPESLSCFLHGIAYRLALKARTERERRRSRERQAALPDDSPEADMSWREVRGLLDEELQRLPQKQRLPLVLCYLEGLTQDEASRRLGWSRGTLKRRLEAGRERLRIRLTRRGVTLGAGLFAVVLTESSSRAAVSVTLRNATVRAAMQFLTNETSAVAATPAMLLAKGALQSMLTTKLKLGALLLLALSCAATAAGLAIPQAPPEKKPEIKVETPARSVEEKQARKDRYGDPLPQGAIARLGTLRFRHLNMTASAVFTRDSKTVIVGDGDGFVVYWDVATGREVRRLPRMQGAIYALAITRDGKTLAAGAWGNVSLWEVATGKLLSKVEVKNDAIMQMLFTPDGKTLAVRYQGDVIDLVDVAGDKKLRELKGHAGKVATMDLSPDGKTLASGSWKDPHIRLWDIATGKEKLHFTTGGTDVLSVAFSPDGKTLAAIGNSVGFGFFDPNTGKLLRKAKDYFGGVSQIYYAPDGKTLLGLESNNSVHVVDAASGKHLRKFEAPLRTMAGLTISPDGKTVATFWGGANTFDLWDAASGKLLHSFEGHRESITGLAFAADGKTLFSAAGITAYKLLAWNATTGELYRPLAENGNGYQRVALSPDGTLLAACGYGDLRLWDAASRKEVRRFRGHKEAIMSVAWSADSKTLVTGSNDDKSIRIWDAANGKELRRIAYNVDWVGDVALSPDGKLVAAGGYQDGTIHLWSADTGKELPPLVTSQNNIMSTLAFSPDGSVLASGGGAGGIQLWDLTTMRLRQSWGEKRGWVGQLVFSRDGRTLVSGHGDHNLRLWEVATGKERVCFSGHRGAVQAVALSLDGRRVASGSTDTTILIWDATTGAGLDAAHSADHLRNLWDDLSATNAGRAYRAIWQMALSPKDALPFLAERVRPVAPLDEARQKRADRLVADLDSEQFAVRQEAETELEKMGPMIEPALRDALKNKPSLEVRRRIEALLGKWTGERLRIMRALEAIEHMNTPEARRLVEALADGVPGAWLTEEARAIRKRLVEPSVTASER